MEIDLIKQQAEVKMSSVVFEILGSGENLILPKDRINEFVVLKLLHQDGVHIIANDKISSEIARDLQGYIDTGMVNLDETIDVLEMLGKDVNVEKLPRDMIKLYLKEERFRKSVNMVNSKFRNFEHLIELDQSVYEEMRDVAIAYRKTVPQLLKSPHSPNYLEWSKVKRKVKRIISELRTLHGGQIFPKKFYRNYMIAGGSISSILHDEFLNRKQDVDVFVVAQDDTLREEIKQHYATLSNYSNINLNEPLEFRYNENVVSIRKEEHGEIQVIKRFYKIFDQILHGFDVDASCVGVTFDGRIWMTERFKYAFMKNCLTVNISRLSRSYELRLAKYHRRGWDLYIPGTLVEPIPPIDIELDTGEKISFSEIESALDPRWHLVSVAFNSLSKEEKLFLSNKLRINWYRFEGIDLLWIATATDVKFRTGTYNVTLSKEINSNWRVDEPDSQHTGSFHPSPRDTRWFNITVDKYIMPYIPIARLVIKKNMYLDKIVSGQEPTQRLIIKQSIWKNSLLYECHVHGVKIYISDYMINRFIKYFGIVYSDLKPSKYMLVNRYKYDYANYVIDVETELVVGTLDSYSYGKIVPVYVTIEHPEEDPTLYKLWRPLPFERAEGLITSYCRYYDDLDMINFGASVMYDLLERYTVELPNNVDEYIDLNYPPEYVKWHNSKVEEMKSKIRAEQDRDQEINDLNLQFVPVMIQGEDDDEEENED